MAAASVVTPAALAADILPAATAAIWATLRASVRRRLYRRTTPTTTANRFDHDRQGPRRVAIPVRRLRLRLRLLRLRQRLLDLAARPHADRLALSVGVGLLLGLYSGGRTAQRTAPSAGIPRILARRRRRFGLRLDLAPLGKIDRRIQDHLIARPQRVIHLDRRAEIARHRDVAEVNNALVHDGDAQSVGVEHDGVCGNDQAGDLAWNMQLDRAVDP